MLKKQGKKRKQDDTPNPKFKMSGALLKALRKAENKPMGGASWKGKKVGDCIGGEVVSMQEKDMKYGPVLCVTINTSEGPYTILCNDPLTEEMKREKIKVGNEIVILYKGEVPTDKGHPARIYAVSKA